MVEIQIRTDRFCALVMNELNSRPLSAAKIDNLDALKGKALERIICADCELARDSEGTGRVELRMKMIFKYHDNLNTLRAAGSLQPGPLSEAVIPFKIVFTIDQNPRPALVYELLAYEVASAGKGGFPIAVPEDFAVTGAAIEANAEVVCIRIGTLPLEPLLQAPVNRLSGREWVQLIPGDLIAENFRQVLDRAVDAAVVSPPPPDPLKPWLPKPKHQELRKGHNTQAAWTVFPIPSAHGQGEIIAVDACPLFETDISIELNLLLLIAFPDANTMKTTAVLSWDADSTLCDILATLVLGIPIGVGFHIGIENEVSSSILDKKIKPGGFANVGQTDESITFERVSGPPAPPSADFERTHAEVTADGFNTSGIIRPKSVYPVLAGEMIPATAGLHMDCNIRSVSMVFNHAQVVLRNKAAGYFGPPPTVFWNETIFEPAGAWSIRTDIASMADPHSTARQTVLTFVDPPSGRLPAGTRTSVYLFTNFGVRWVDLGVIPTVPAAPPVWAHDLMTTYCNSIVNPWARGMTRLGWTEEDPLLDPDYGHHFAIDPLRLWTVGLRELPSFARIELLAIASNGNERLLGTIEGKQSTVLQLVTEATETLAIRSINPFTAPAPKLSRNWIYPFAAEALYFEPHTIQSNNGLLELIGKEQQIQSINLQEMGIDSSKELQATVLTEVKEKQVKESLSRKKAKSREAWSSITHIDKRTIVVTHRGKLLAATLGAARKVQ